MTVESEVLSRHFTSEPIDCDAVKIGSQFVAYTLSQFVTVCHTLDIGEFDARFKLDAAATCHSLSHFVTLCRVWFRYRQLGTDGIATQT